MSSVDDLDREFRKTRNPELKRALLVLKRQAQRRASSLKHQRKIVDAQARVIFKQHYNPKGPKGKKWEGGNNGVYARQFRALMTKRHKLHERVARLVPEKIEPEWDSP